MGNGLLVVILLSLIASCNRKHDEIVESHFPTLVGMLTTRYYWCQYPSCSHFKYEVYSRGETRGIPSSILKVTFDLDMKGGLVEQCLYAHLTHEVAVGKVTDVIVTEPVKECDQSKVWGYRGRDFGEVLQSEGFQGKVPKVISGNSSGGKMAESTHLATYLDPVKTIKTPSGLRYQVLREGTGKSPTVNDRVEVHYHGTLIDGSVFDSSVTRGKPFKFPLNKVILGWVEGIQTMQVGGKTRFLIPPNLAYGSEGAPPAVPKNATLLFEVELLKINEE